MKVLDLFAGAGGLGEGFFQAGFEMSASIDNDIHCINTLKSRALFRHYKSINKQKKYFDLIKNSDLEERLKLYQELSSKKLINEKIESIDLSKTDNPKIMKEIINISDNPDIIIGGPPCQAYSLMNRKARRDSKDIRHKLFRNYLHIIDEIKPKIFIFENVVGMTSTVINEKNIIQLFEEDLNNLKTKYKILSKNNNTLFDNLSYNRKDYIFDMSLYGLPQKRRRFILVAIRGDIFKEIDSFKLSESIFKEISSDRFTVSDAIRDLPELFLNKKRGNNIFLNEKIDKRKTSLYGKSLINDKIDGVFNHMARTHMDEDLKRYKFLSELPKNKRSSNTLELFQKYHPNLLPKHKNLSSFNDRFKVQYGDSLGSTIMAHISKDGHYYIHYDPKQNRSLTVREAARLQGFPDDYFFEGPRTEQFKMVGNAVPPFFARIIAKTLLKSLS